MAGSISRNEPIEALEDKAALEKYFKDRAAEQEGMKVKVGRLVIIEKKGATGETIETLVYRPLEGFEGVKAKLWGGGPASLTKVIPYINKHQAWFQGPDGATL